MGDTGEMIQSIHCTKTRILRTGDDRNNGNAHFPDSAQRRNRIVAHQKRIQDAVRRRKG